MDAPHQQQMVVLRVHEELAYHVKSLRRSSRPSSDHKNDDNAKDDQEFAVKFSVIPAEPQTYPPCYTFQFDGADYPAMLMNIPTPVEALKTYDNKVFHKSGDVGQILQVFRNEQERDAMRAQLVTEPYDLYYPHGLTAPTEDIVRRRFDATRINESFLTFRYQEVLAEVLDFSTRSGANLIPSSKITDNPKFKKQQQNNADGDENDGDNPEETLPYYETIVEEVLDYEEYMMDVMNPGYGRTLQFDGLDWTEEQIALVSQHPEIIWSRLEEEDDVLEQQGREMLLKKKTESASAAAANNDTSVSKSAIEATTEPSMVDITMETLSLKFRKNAAGTGIELANEAAEDAVNVDTSASNTMQVDQINDNDTKNKTSETITESEELPSSSTQKAVDSSRAAAMLSMLLDGEGEDAEEGEGEEENEIEDVVAVKTVEEEEGAIPEEEEGGDENMGDTDWMDDL